jgi:hypothetical protein
VIDSAFIIESKVEKYILPAHEHSPPSSEQSLVLGKGTGTLLLQRHCLGLPGAISIPEKEFLSHRVSVSFRPGIRSYINVLSISASVSLGS